MNFLTVPYNANLKCVMENENLKFNFIKYNTILPSSAAVERLFSIARLILSPKRFCLSGSLFEELLFLKTTKKYKILDC